MSKFILAKPKRWKNKLSGKEFKVLPWFQPMQDESRFDFKGLIKEIFPELSSDILKDFEVYSGLVMQVGWSIENENSVWINLVGNKEIEDQFEIVGDWNE